MKFNENIRALREDNDLTQKDIAEKLNMTQRRISRLETGTTEPTIEDIKSFCELFNKNSIELLGF